MSREPRFARNRDQHIVDRTRLTSALAGTEDQLEHTLTQRATLVRELGDPAAIREERDGLTSAIDTLVHQHTELRNQLADLEVQRRPRWACDTLGERPERTPTPKAGTEQHARSRDTGSSTRSPNTQTRAGPAPLIPSNASTTSEPCARATNSPNSSHAKHPDTSSTSTGERHAAVPDHPRATDATATVWRCIIRPEDSSTNDRLSVLRIAGRVCAAHGRRSASLPQHPEPAVLPQWRA
jgi:hypothetical protein